MKRARDFRSIPVFRLPTGFAWIAFSTLLWPADAFGQQSPPPSPPEIHEHVGVTAPLLTPTREASGTAWLPAVTPMYGIHSRGAGGTCG